MIFSKGSGRTAALWSVACSEAFFICDSEGSLKCDFSSLRICRYFSPLETFSFSLSRWFFLRKCNKRLFLTLRRCRDARSHTVAVRLCKNLMRWRKREDAWILLKPAILKTRVASLTPSRHGHLSLSTTAALPILEISQFVVIKQTWALSSSLCNCLVTLFHVNIISCSFNSLSLSFCFDGRGGGMSAGWRVAAWERVRGGRRPPAQPHQQMQPGNGEARKQTHENRWI